MDAVNTINIIYNPSTMWTGFRLVFLDFFESTFTYRFYSNQHTLPYYLKYSRLVKSRGQSCYNVVAATSTAIQEVHSFLLLPGISHNLPIRHCNHFLFGLPTWHIVVNLSWVKLNCLQPYSANIRLHYSIYPADNVLAIRIFSSEERHFHCFHVIACAPMHESFHL